MSTILAIALLTGAGCVSPVEGSDALKVTVVGKTPCAIVIHSPVGNPYKAAQEPNVVTAAAGAPAFKYAPKKKAKKKKRKARR